jgi:hypothetical protein
MPISLQPRDPAGPLPLPPGAGWLLRRTAAPKADLSLLASESGYRRFTLREINAEMDLERVHLRG